MALVYIEQVEDMDVEEMQKTHENEIKIFLNSTNSKKLKEDHLYIPKTGRLCCKSGWHKL